MKQFTTLKVGYTWSKMFGLRCEYFTTIYIDKAGIHSLSHKGMYGSDDRVNNEFKAKGYEEKYIPNDYGLMTAKEVMNIFLYEKEAIEKVKTL